MSSNLYDSIKSNELRVCRVRGCSHPQMGLGPYCNSHRTKKKLYGCPEGRRIRPREYATELQDARTFIEEKIDHRAIQEALRLLGDWLHAAALGKPRTPAIRELQRLEVAGVTPRRILEELAAVWLYSERYPSRLKDDDQLTYALGASILYLAPRDAVTAYSNPDLKKGYRKVRGVDRREAGQFVRMYLGALFKGIHRKLTEQQEQEQQRRAALMTPL